MKRVFLIEKPFDAKKTLECGQIFRFIETCNGFEVRTQNLRCHITQLDNKAQIECEDVEYFKHFFDVDSDYIKMTNELRAFPELKNAISFGNGIHIIKNNCLEMIVSFIISANNNIKRIKKTIDTLCEKFGTETIDCFGKFFAFPSLEQLKNIKEEDFLSIGCGYRSRLLKRAIEQITDDWLEKIQTMNTIDACKFLIDLPGVGSKVADCILLFGLSRSDVFPVDVWVERSFLETFGHANKNIKSREQMRRFYIQRYKNLSGLAQQYFFYEIRERS